MWDFISEVLASLSFPWGLVFSLTACQILCVAVGQHQALHGREGWETKDVRISLLRECVRKNMEKYFSSWREFWQNIHVNTNCLRKLQNRAGVVIYSVRSTGQENQNVSAFPHSPGAIRKSTCWGTLRWEDWWVPMNCLPSYFPLLPRPPEMITLQSSSEFIAEVFHM